METLLFSVHYETNLFVIFVGVGHVTWCWIKGCGARNLKDPSLLQVILDPGGSDKIALQLTNSRI